jgi:hypothetical protein
MSQSYAQSKKSLDAMKKVDRALLYEQEDYEKVNPRKAQYYPEIYLHDDSFLKEEESSTGLYSDLYYTKLDSTRVSFAYQMSHDYEEFSKLQSLDLQFMRKIKSYKDQWWGIQIKKVTAKYNALADELTSTTGHPDSDANSKRFDNEQSMTMLGLGFGYRFKALTGMINSDRIYESVMAYANYITHFDSSNSKNYTGYGLTAEYGIQKRMSEGFFSGIKIGYNLASLSRPATTDEKLADRSLIFKWASIGFEFGYYF